MKSSRCLLYISLWLSLSFGQTAIGATSMPESSKGELIPLRLEVVGKLVFDIDARLYEEQIYLPAGSLFSALRIRHSWQNSQSRLLVNFPSPDDPVEFIIKDISDGKNFIRDKQEVYIRKGHLEAALELHITYDFRSLSLYLDSPAKLPVIEIHERKNRYETFVPQSVKFSPDENLLSRYHLLNGWVADWSINNSHSALNNHFSYNLGLGGQLLGGSFSLYGSGSKDRLFHDNQLRGKWHLPIYSTPLITRATLGYLYHDNSLGLANRTYRGFKITNRPRTPRQNFNRFYHSGMLKKGWDSELYVNHRLQDFAVGSREQEYRFSTPLQYGTNLIQLKYYDQNGLHHQKQHLIHIPQEFLPPGEFQYTLSGGRYSNAAGGEFGRLDMQWGLSPNITLSGGSIADLSGSQTRIFPFLQSWLRLGNNMIISGSHTYRRMSEGALRLMFSGSQSLRMDLKRYYRTPGYNKLGKSLETSLNTSFPVKIGFLDISTFINSRYTRLYSGNQNLNILSGLSTRLPLGIYARFSNRMVLHNADIRKVRPVQTESNLQLSRRILTKLFLGPRLSFDHHLQEVSGFGVQMNLRVTSRSYLNFSFDHDVRLQNNRFMVSFKLDLPFARHTSYARSGAGKISVNQITTGSIAFSNQSKSLYFDKRKRMEKAGLVLNPFLDLNNNGKKDNGEKVVKGVTADVYRQGHNTPAHENRKMVENLIPYEKYYITVDDSGISNPLWKAQHSSYSISLLPNRLNSISIPISVTGEVAGSVELKGAGNHSLYGLEVILASVGQGEHTSSKSAATATESRFTKTLTTYTGGNFYHVGLMPGRYKAMLNKDQLKQRSLAAVQDSVTFTIEAVEQGDIVDGLSLQVTSLDHRSTMNKPLPTPQEPSGKLYTIQIGAFHQKANAERMIETSELKNSLDVLVFYDLGDYMYKCRLSLFDRRMKAQDVLNKLKLQYPHLYKDAFVFEIP